MKNSIKKTNVSVVTLAIFITTFMTAIEGTIVSTAMPTIVSDLNGLEIMNWVVSVFLLMTAVSTPVYGKLADSWGRKPVFLFGIILFVIGSSLCALSQNMTQLIIFRVIQGLGSGAIQPVAITVLADLYAIDKRAKMLGLNASFWGVASIIAPLLGGFIVQHLSWHWVFLINVPIGIIAAILILVYLVEPNRKRNSKIDLKGIALLTIFLLALMTLLQELGNHDNPIIYAILVLVDVFALYFFIKTEKKAQDPILPLGMLEDHEFIAENIITLLVSGVVIGFEFYLPTWMQGINGTTATAAGFAVTPSSVMWVIGSFVVGTLMARYGVKKVFDFALTLILLADLALIFVPIQTAYWVYCLIAAMNGFGFGLIITAAQVKSQVIVSKDNIGVATSFNTLMKYLGQTMMVSIYGIAFNLTVAAGLKQHHNLNASMMNKIVNSQKARELPIAIAKQLRVVLHSSLQMVYIVSLVAIILSFVFNRIYQEKARL